MKRVNPASLAKPSGFSHATVATGTTVFLAGQTGLDLEGHIVEGGLVAQFEQALTNLLTALAASGGQPRDLASMTVYIVDMDDYRARAREIGEVWKRLVGADYPAMAGIGAQTDTTSQSRLTSQGELALPAAYMPLEAPENLDPLGILPAAPYFTSDLNTNRIPTSSGTSTQIALVTPRCAHSAAVRAPS